MTRAIIYIPGAVNVAEHYDRCKLECEARGWKVAGVSTGTWQSVDEDARRIQGVVVVAEPGHLDPNRKPRVVIARPAPDEGGHRRTRIIRREG